MVTLPLKVCNYLQTKHPTYIVPIVTKALTLFEITVGALGVFFNPRAEPYVKLFFQNTNSGYAEVRLHVCFYQPLTTYPNVRYANTSVGISLSS